MPARLDHLTALLDKESLHSRVNNVITPPSQLPPASLSPGPELVQTAESARKHERVGIVSHAQAIEAQCAQITEQSDLLRQQIAEAKEENAARKAAYERRRSEVAAETKELRDRVPLLLEPLKATIDQLDRKMERVHKRTLQGRAKLCQETARLAGLSLRRRRSAEGQVFDECHIGGVSIVDLRQLNNARPEHVTASLANICRLLATCCHYLAVRLPAEIVPPHANYPHPTIFSTHSSYTGIDVPFPGSSTSSPSTSRVLEHRSLPKPRLLHLDRPLDRLAKEDPHKYNLFVEGITLLAWDVAWLCTSQGVPVEHSWESICCMGPNLYSLFREHTLSPRRSTKPSLSAPSRLTASGALEAETPLPQFGDLSHAGAFRNLASHEGAQAMHGWKSATPARIIDKVKSYLQTEISGADWEMIAEEEWDAEREDEQAVLVGGTRHGEASKAETASRITATNAVSELDLGVRGRGTSGWTKLKSRSGEDG
ncbi:hypothetical protein MBLNU459_g4656t1 [Dothideomycetes sp. NU459]